jgi:hypothetical protein
MGFPSGTASRLSAAGRPDVGAPSHEHQSVRGEYSLSLAAWEPEDDPAENQSVVDVVGTVRRFSWRIGGEGVCLNLVSACLMPLH